MNEIEIFERKILKVGAKLTISLPLELCRQLNIEKGSNIQVVADPETGIIILKRRTE